MRMLLFSNTPLLIPYIQTVLMSSKTLDFSRSGLDSMRNIVLIYNRGAYTFENECLNSRNIFKAKQTKTVYLDHEKSTMIRFLYIFVIEIKISFSLLLTGLK